MAVYGERRRLTTPVMLAGVLVVILVVVGAVFAFARLRGSPDLEAQRRLIAQEAQQMIEGLDVLTISHYTDEVVRNGQVLLADEYRAARDNLQEIRRHFEAIRPYLAPLQAEEVETALRKLEAMVEEKRPAVEVEQQVEQLIDLLTQLDR